MAKISSIGSQRPCPKTKQTATSSQHNLTNWSTSSSFSYDIAKYVSCSYQSYQLVEVFFLTYENTEIYRALFLTVPPDFHYQNEKEVAVNQDYFFKKFAM